ncbi:nagb/rpia/CoA transferase-like protein [Ramaria rubella]|nr:nagb/rpia/CoA transferase-like protein [Ramaria rubella]
MTMIPETTYNQSYVEQFAAILRRRQLVGARLTALQTVNVLRQVVATAQFSTIEELIDLLKSVGQQLQDAQPKERSVGNVVLKMIHLIREEHGAGSSAPANDASSFSLANFVLLGQPRRQRNAPKNIGLRSLQEDLSSVPDSFAKAIKPVIIEAIQDVQYELETVYESVAKNAKDHIHSDEIVLTIGASRTVEAFLKSAAHHRKFTVIVAETAPSYTGRTMARSLSSAGISTFLVPDSSIYAIMSRVNKVIIGAHAILANGGFIATTGSSLVVTAARAHSTPVIVCAGQFKFTRFTPIYRHHGALDYGNPSHVLGFQEGSLVDNVDVINPTFDYVEPELVDVFVTNDGDHPPSSVFR